ncbi:hypothetical protein ACFQ5J_01550 [Lacticaseibacillus baoqingensis]|uniref:Uncharacterized protein n=1 Tax=Lacticaseibacillus baoqingensis TaxID=2486013 RepID=A0ABW4E526_9LACO|nr:hypothetical protein [Lacticaseibacillus baoqingensis]
MRRLIKRFGYHRVLLTTIIALAVITVALAATTTMAIKTQHQLDSWVTFTMN